MLECGLAVVGLGSVVTFVATSSVGERRLMIASVAQAALCVQYTVYFVRNRHRFVTRPRDAMVLPAME